jgi:hypothetical protein
MGAIFQLPRKNVYFSEKYVTEGEQATKNRFKERQNQKGGKQKIPHSD